MLLRDGKNIENETTSALEQRVNDLEDKVEHLMALNDEPYQNLNLGVIRNNIWYTE